MSGFLADCRHALRLYSRTPGASLIAIIALAVAMAFVGSFLSLYVDLVLRPHSGIEDASRIVTIGQGDGVRFTGIPLLQIDRMAAEMAAVETATGVETTLLPVAPDGDGTVVEVVTDGFFSGIRPRLSLGRGFDSTDHDPDSEPVVVISDRYWRERFDARPDVIGESIELVQRQFMRTTVVNGRMQIDEQDSAPENIAFRIVGVMAPEMAGVMNDDVAFWAPFETIIGLILGGNTEDVRSDVSMRSLARLQRGASVDALVRELSDHFADYSSEELRRPAGFRLEAIAGVVRNVGVHRDAQRQLQLFLAGSLLLALVAAANVSLFLLARAPGRRRELAIRMSVGAPLARLARQLASEAGLLVVVSAALGLMFSGWLVNLLRGLAFLRQAQWSNVSLVDWRVLALVGAFLLVLTLLVSLAPILGLKRLGLASSGRQIAARATLAQRIAGTAQIAIAGALGGAAVAFGWFLGSMVLGYPGYMIEDRHYVQFSPFFTASANPGGSVVNLDGARLRETIASLPSVQGITVSSLVPAGQTVINTRTIPHPADPNRVLTVGYGAIDSHFVDVLRLRLLYGSAPGDDATNVALINLALAREVFGRDNAVGETLTMSGFGVSALTVVGVLENLSFLHPAADVEPMVFIQTSPTAFGTRAVVESPLSGAELRAQLQGLIDSGELETQVMSVDPLANLRSNLLAPDQARSLLTIGTAILVVVLAAFGFYGTQRYLVMAGRREYAIRAALGAGPTALGRLVFRRGLRLSLPGLVAGGLLAAIVAGWLQDDFTARDITPLPVAAVVVIGLLLLLLLASLGPARQARHTQPAPLLRED